MHIGTRAAAARLAVAALAGLAACASPAPSLPPLYSPAEQRAQCERAGGWWHGDFCEPNSQM